MDRSDREFEHTPVMESLEELLKQALSNMKYLAHYRFMMYPLTKCVANAIGDNNIGLQDLVLFLVSENFEEHWSLLVSLSRFLILSSLWSCRNWQHVMAMVILLMMPRIAM